MVRCAWKRARGLAIAGYGTQEPSSASDCWVTIVSLLAGTVIWTYLASIITTLLISMNAASSEYLVKIQEIDTYMQHRHLPQVRSAPPIQRHHSQARGQHREVGNSARR